MGGDDLAEELQAYISGWKVLLARATQGPDFVEEKLRQLGVVVEHVDNVISVLARVESGDMWQAIVVEKNLLGDEADGLLRAIVKLCPKTGIVVLCEDPEREPSDLLGNISFVSRRVDPARVAKAMVDAKGLAAQRQVL